MATILQVYGTEETLTVPDLGTLGPAGKAQVEVDNSVNLHISDDYDVEITSADNTGTVDIYRAGSNVSGNVPGNADIVNVWDFVKSIDMSATKKKVDFRLEQLKKFNTLLFVNNSGGALTGYTVKRQGADLSNA